LLVDLAGRDCESKIHIVRCGVDLETYTPRVKSQPTDPFRIVAVGSLRDYKGHELLIRACRLLRDSHPDTRFACEIIGEGPLRRDLERLITELRLADCVRLAGALDQTEVLQQMVGADLLAMPSVIAANGLMEGLPVTLMEAMAVGLPVVATRISGIPELVVDGETGLLIPAGHAVALRDAIAVVMADPVSAGKRAARGRELIEQEYDLKRNVSRLEGLFDHAMTVQRSVVPA
jgi:glycosyltransferase involved in cell wall biosynthesis